MAIYGTKKIISETFKIITLKDDLEQGFDKHKKNTFLKWKFILSKGKRILPCIHILLKNNYSKLMITAAIFEICIILLFALISSVSIGSILCNMQNMLFKIEV